MQSREHDSAGVVHLTFTQQAAGLDVFGTYVKATFSATGDLVHVVENLVSTSAPLRPAQVSERAALQAVLARYYPAVSGELAERSVAGNVVTYQRGSAVPPAADGDPHRDPAQGQRPRCRIPRRDLGPQQRPEAHGRVGPR